MNEDAIQWVDGVVTLSETEHDFWLEKFGSIRMLELALVSLAGDCVPNPRGYTHYTARARAYLARLAMGKLARDIRFGAAKEVPPDNKLKAPVWRAPVDGSKRLVQGTPAFAAVLERLRAVAPEEARQVERRGWVWVSRPEPVGPLVDNVVRRVRP